PFTVVGLLNPAQSIVDNLILSNLASVWEVHGIAHNGEHIHGEHCDHNHDHNDGHNHAHETPSTAQSHKDEHKHDHADHDHAHHEGHDHSHEDHKHEHRESSHAHEEELVTEKPQNNDFIKSL